MPHTSDSARATTATGTGAPPQPPSTSYRDSAPLALVALLFAFRLVSALTQRTFFQPDEFFQSLEPAWQLAFGTSSHAWITWEWRTQLRSSLHPALFAAAYRVAADLADLCGLSLPAKAEVLLAAPKVTQAVLAALLDCYTWKLAEKVYGRGSRVALTTLALSICSPWQWFCSTRTLSNCAETTITAIAVYHWPWHWRRLARDSSPGPKGKSQIASQTDLGSVSELRLSLLLAGLACVLRPTNSLIWLSVSIPTLWQASNRLRHVLVREILFCGSAVIACSVASDRLYYGFWTLPPLRFLYFNIAQSLAVFYGKNRADYYFTEGLPLLLTTALPFAVVGLWQSVRGSRGPTSPASDNPSTSTNSSASATDKDEIQHHTLTRLAYTSIFMTVVLSLISHKEVRFLYPILPFLHIIAAKPLSSFLSPPVSFPRKTTILLLMTVNILLAGYVSQIHQRGVIDVLSYIRHKHETRNALSSHTGTLSPPTSNTTVGFLMPCHSTPWRSHLIYPSITAWALTCEPPLNTPLSSRSTYLDEADEFYIKPGPLHWLRSNMEDVASIKTGGSRSGQHWIQQDPKFKREWRREWPQNLVFFEALEALLTEYLGGTRYRECWRGFNSQWHDDGRRVGDVVVWCLDGE
ncbi:glycosyltransferase family 22 protein [Plenodomus tracheiphilus IPT5]|uniref:Mannosyltransferase n=1 Tax=Plenodomus tracheiphilus IPT5 TaxID=1408161 RepID=A0A6A7B0K0_9PLEO|nr:glycosyltransferase family 22 protein [Plenodomus tracheiphilus IPT5]